MSNSVIFDKEIICKKDQVPLVSKLKPGPIYKIQIYCPICLTGFFFDLDKIPDFEKVQKYHNLLISKKIKL